MITTETTTVYRGGGRRWLTAETAAKKEAQAMHRLHYKSRCECDQPEYGREFGECVYPGNTCYAHQPEFYQRWVKRVSRILLKGLK